MMIVPDTRLWSVEPGPASEQDSGKYVHILTAKKRRSDAKAVVKSSAFDQGFSTNRHVRSANQSRTQETVRRDVLLVPAFLNSQARARCKVRSNLSTDEADVVCLILVRVVVEQRRTYEAIIIGKHQEVVLSAPRPGVSGFRETTVRFVDIRVVDVRSRSPSIRRTLKPFT